jgi:4-amino-4-deoxy-L-arabinose transferase-like glycosyltransferase
MRNIKKYIIFLGSLIVIALPICYQAYTNKLFSFDEGYYFIASYELGEHGRFFIDFDSASLLRNTKPYLFVFIQAGLGKLIGWNEWAIRIPTILSSITLVYVLFFFIKKQFDNALWAITSALTLLVVPCFINMHMAFTGDHDIPLTLFTTSFLFAFYLFLIEADEKKTGRYIFIACLCAGLSVLTKGWMILFFLPVSLVYSIVYKKFKLLFFNKGFLSGTGIAAVLILSWYLGREYVDPGYLKAVWQYEIGRYNDGVHSVHPEFGYYWQMLYQHQISFWLVFLFPALYFICNADIKERRFVIYCFFQSVFFLILLSFSKVKLAWYDAPVIPVIVLISGYGAAKAIQLISSYTFSYNKAVMFFLCTVLYIYPYAGIFQRRYERFFMDTYGEFMMHKHIQDSYSIVRTAYNPHLIFYTEYCKEKFNTEHILKTSRVPLSVHEKVLVCEPVVMLGINRKYEYKVLDSLEKSKLIEITALRP